MKFSDRKNTRSNRRWASSGAPAEIETFESRLLLTTVPSILTPTGTVTDPTPEITWEAVDNATSYDLWVTSLVSYETLFVVRGIEDTSYVPAEGTLGLGKIRVWARANLEGGGTSAWSVGKDATIQSAPTITGPVGTGPQNITYDNTPEITWNSPTLAERFQIWVTDLTAKAAAEAAAGDDPVDVSLHSTVYTVLNQQPLLDADGNAITDADGNPVLSEVRSFVLPQDTNPNATTTEERELPISRYRIWMRSMDDVGTLSAWSAGHTFDVGPKPENLAPTTPTFQRSPVLMFDAIDGATHYEVFVSRDGAAGPFFRRIVEATNDTRESVRIVQSVAGGPIVQTNAEPVGAHEIPRLDEDGEEVPFNILTNPGSSFTFWVRAISEPEDGPVVTGLWSNPARFQTLIAPTIIGPETVGGVVTAGLPTLEWTPIDGAARYELIINKFNSRPSFLEVGVTGTSYTFTETIPRGDYTAWVRPISNRGDAGPWSAAKNFTATGGRPVVIVPDAGDVQLFPTFEWSAVTDDNVVSYDIWVSHVGVDFTFININVTGTSYTGAEPLDDGNYRVWIRAVYADGSNGAWSDPVNFVGGIVLDDSAAAEPESFVASVEVDLSPAITEAVVVEAVVVEAKANSKFDDAPPVNDFLIVQTKATDDSIEMPAASSSVAVDSPESLISTLAEQCAASEWWEA